MTARKHLKRLVRSRMTRTGESYAAARRHILREDPPTVPPFAARWHLPGSVPATTALRILLSHAGVPDPQTGRPFTEAMLFGLAGGIGIGIFAFRYEKGDFSSFFIGGRHLWHGDEAYLTAAVEAFGLRCRVDETGSRKEAADQLSRALESAPCVAWVDAASLPHRAMSEQMAGGAYHVVTVYSIDAAARTALVGDLTDEPVVMPLSTLAEARARIKKQKNRLLTLVESPRPTLRAAELARSGVRRCVRELRAPSMKAARRNFQLEALRTWADRMENPSDPESWERVFRPGLHFWRGLTSVYDWIENYGTGGGLSRPMFADFLREAAPAIPELEPLAGQYERIGGMWSELAQAALPEHSPALVRARQLLDTQAELRSTGADPDEIRPIRQELDALEAQATAEFPLSGEACALLRADLGRRIRALYEVERAGLQRLAAIAA